MNAKEELGRWGEAHAAAYLKREGLTMAAQHFQTRWGEIDLVARDGDTWVFVEVKTRQHQNDISAADAITPSKQKRLVNAALSFMKMRHLEGSAMRFDVILIEEKKVEWLKDAFESAVPYTF